MRQSFWQLLCDVVGVEIRDSKVRGQTLAHEGCVMRVSGGGGRARQIVVVRIIGVWRALFVV